MNGQHHRPRLNQSHALILVLAVALTMAGGSVYWYVFSPTRAATSGFSALGSVVGAETIQMADGQGTVVVLHSSGDPGPADRARDSAFRKAIRQASGITITAEEVMPAEYENPAYAGFSAKWFVDMARKYPTATIFVSFAGYPQFEEADVATRPRGTMKLITVTPWEPDLRLLERLLSAGIVHVAVVPHIESSAGPQKSKDVPAEFAKHFRILRPESQPPQRAAPGQ